jgi:hypothetical protein
VAGSSPVFRSEKLKEPAGKKKNDSEAPSSPDKKPL